MGFVKTALAGKAKIIAPKFDGKREIKRVSTDSRSAGPGDLFVAVKGDNFDGHDFIAQAVSRGVEGVLCEKYPADATQEGIDIFLVADTMDAFRTLARHWREYVDPTIVAVAGSVGKTTTKDILAALLSAKWQKVLKTTGSQNGFLGIPLTLMELTAEHEVAVIEVGIDAPGAMIQHIDVVRPDFAIVTAISEEHLEWLIDLKTIAYEENLILKETAQADGTVVINLDDPWIFPLMTEIASHKKIGFTMRGAPSPYILAGSITKDGKGLSVEGLGHKRFEISLPLPGEHNARNQLGAIATALAMGVRPDDLQDGIENFAPSGGRSQMERTGGGTEVLCDFYNANPASMRAAFKVAESHAASDATLWLCLADMKELGAQEEALHRGLAKDIVAIKTPTTLLLYGDRMKWLAEELKTAGYTGSCKLYQSHDELGAELKKHLKSTDFVLLKGSRSMKMERVWDLIKA